MIFVCLQGLNAAAAIIVVPLCRPVLPGGPLPQAADLHNGSGQIGNVLLHIRQLVRDVPQFIQEKKLFAVRKINVKAAQIIAVQVGGKFEEL